MNQNEIKKSIKSEPKTIQNEVKISKKTTKKVENNEVKKKPRKCSVCGQTGHNKKNCPNK